MAESTWTNPDSAVLDEQPSRLKFIVAGIVIAGVIIALVYNAVQSSSQLYVTVDEYFANEARYATRDMRVAGWVVEDSVVYTQIDAENSRLEFEIVENLAVPGRTLRVVAVNEPKPDLLHGEAQAVAIGRVGDDGAFYVEPGGLLLKCPTRYEELDPEA
jgi:cytochrome c-type biogenesis protein CcmE